MNVEWSIDDDDKDNYNNNNTDVTDLEIDLFEG